MKVDYSKGKYYYDIVLDDKLYFRLSSKEFSDNFIKDFTNKLSDDVIDLYYDDNIVSVDDVVDIIENNIKKELYMIKSNIDYLECPSCLELGLRLYDYGDDQVYECDKCGYEIWFWKEKGIEETCREIKLRIHGEV